MFLCGTKLYELNFYILKEEKKFNALKLLEQKITNLTKFNKFAI